MFPIRQSQAAAMVALILSLLVSCADITGSTKLGSNTKSSSKAITAFSLSTSSSALLLSESARKAEVSVGVTGSGTINEAAKTITVAFAAGTNVSALTATFTTTGSSVLVGTTIQTSGTTANNFASPVVYRVVAEDGTTADYTVTVTVGLAAEIPLSSAKALTTFTLSVPSSNFNIGPSRVAVGASPAAGSGTINESAKTIAVAFPAGTNVSALTATFTTTGSSVRVGTTLQTSGTTANNFTSPVVYQVTAADGSTADYTVTVTVAAAVVADTVKPTLPTPSTVTGSATTTSMTLNWAASTDTGALMYRVSYRTTPMMNAGISGSRAILVAASGWTTASDWAAASAYPDTVSGSGLVYQVSGLTLGKSYDFQVSVRDAALNQSDYTLLTASTVGDLVAPTLSSNTPTVSTTSGVTILSWYDAADAVSSPASLRYYVGVSRNGIYIGGDSAWTYASAFSRDGLNRLVKTLLYSGANLVAGNTYTVTITAMDEAGNNASSAAITYTVPAAVLAATPK